MKYKFALFVLPLILSSPLLGDDLSDLKKMAALQQTAITSLEKKVQILEAQLSESNVKAKASEVDLKAAVIKSQSLESGIAGVAAQVNGLIDGSTKVAAITFQNGSRILQDQGISIFPVSERNGQASPYYFHFGSGLEAWKTPYTGENRLIWAWK
ncbi:MAG: hypothetical protein EOP04_04085 [Proteobacteria bacterium]|nr:MAG: hypothetical protein EOP04_04085 [Pseudomonadota bacterium]